MKKTWKQLLGTLASGAMMGAVALGALADPVYGQSQDDGVVVLGSAPQQRAVAPQPEADEGAVRLGGSPTSYGQGVQPASAAQPMTSYDERPIESYVVEDPTIHPRGVYQGNPYGMHAGPSGGSIGYAVTQDPQDILLRVGRRNGDIYGIDEGFTSIGGYLTRNEDANTIWFVNPRLLVTDQGRGGLNLGIGQKAYYPDLDRVFSLSAWWDFDSGHNTDYHQVGLSFEMIGQNMSLRSNANFVVSRDETRVGTEDVGFANFRPTDGILVQSQNTLYEVAYNQADVEVAAPLPLGGAYGWEWAAGAYFLFGGDGRDATGVKGRLESQITEDLWVNAEITSDRIYDTNVSINLEFTLPHAPPSRWMRRPAVRDALYGTVRRNYRVATTIVEQREQIPVRDDNGRIIRLGLINPNLTDDPLMAFGGTGAINTPWLSLADYMDETDATKDTFSILGVFARDDDTDLNLNTTIALRNGQVLLGEGIEHSLDGLGVIPISIPGFETPMDPMNVMLPRLTNSGTLPTLDVITLANNNQVSGFNIDAGGTASGIVGDGISGFNINRVEINNVIDGIRIRSLGAPGGSLGVIRDNMITGQAIDGPSTNGLLIDHQSGRLDLLVQNNTVADFRGDADPDGLIEIGEEAGYGIRIVASGGSELFANDPDSVDLPLGILTNTLTGNGTGLSVEALGGSTLVAAIQDNTATGSTDSGEDRNENELLNVTEDINSNGILDFGSGFNIFSDASSIRLASFTGNTASDGLGNGATFQTINDGVITVRTTNMAVGADDIAFAENTFNNNGLDGMFVRADSGLIEFDQIQDSVFGSVDPANMMGGNGDDGLDLEADNGGEIRVATPLSGNSFTNNGDNGLEITSGVGSEVDVQFDFNEDTGAGTNTIAGNGQNFNALTQNGAGIFIGSTGGTVTASLQGVTSSGNVGSGAIVLADGGTVLLDGIAGNIFRLNGEYGLALIANNGGQIITPFVGSEDILLTNAGIPGLTQFSNDFSLNAEAGLFLGGSNDSLGGTTGLIDLGTVTLNRFVRQGEDIDNDGNVDVDEDANDNGILDAGEDMDGDNRLDVAENLNGAIANGTLDPSQGDEGILIDASDLRIVGTLTQNAFIGRLPVFDTMGNLLTPGSGPGIGGRITGTSTSPAPGGLSFRIGTGIAGDANTFLNNGDAHIGLTLAGNTVNNIVVDDGTFDGAFDLTAANGPPGEVLPPLLTGQGIAYIVRDTAVLTGGVFDSTLSNNEGDGLLISVTGNNDAGNTSLFPAAQLNDFVIMDNEFLSNGTFPGMLANGIEISRTERGQFNDLMIIDNLIMDNSQNGIQISSVGVGQLSLQNMRADTVVIADNEIRSNFMDGIELVVGADADLVARIDNNIITDNGVGDLNGNGIEARERTQDAKDGRSLTGLWTNNTITGNLDDGIDLSAALGNSFSEMTEAANGYTVAPLAAGTTMPILGLVRSWGLVIGDTTLNTIEDGQNENMNLISTNGGDGIDITGGGVATIANNVIVQNGTPEMFGTFLVTRHAGINIDGAESDFSGDFTGTTGGRDLPNDSFDPNRDAFRDLFVFSNLISENNGDGIELLSEPSFDFIDSAFSGGLGGFAIETRLTAALNEITNNMGRGVDILVRSGDFDSLDRNNEDADGIGGTFDGGFIYADVSLIGNDIKGNGEEGIYVVTTADPVQNQVSPSRNTIDATGTSISNGQSLRAQAPVTEIGNFVNLRLDIHDNEIISNGDRVIDFPATGLVIRVGTGGGGSGSFTGSNFFATSGFNIEDLNNDGLLDNDQDGDGFLDAAAVTGAGISASITGNDFAGNFGDDILFHSFTSTVNPPATTGTWNEMEFTIMNFDSDPLARFDLIFSDNRFESIEPNNVEETIGTSPGNVGAPDAGAFYDNPEPAFKSRGNMQTPPGPFNDAGDRQRNATRFASRYLTGNVLPPDPTTSPDQGRFKYPGLGNSTFRVVGTGNSYIDPRLGAVTLEQIFIFDEPELTGDPDLIDAFFEANGVFPDQDPDNRIELPWGWDDLETGTPQVPFSILSLP